MMKFSFSNFMYLLKGSSFPFVSAAFTPEESPKPITDSVINEESNTLPSADSNFPFSSFFLCDNRRKWSFKLVLKLLGFIFTGTLFPLIKQIFIDSLCCEQAFWSFHDKAMFWNREYKETNDRDNNTRDSTKITKQVYQSEYFSFLCHWLTIFIKLHLIESIFH